MPGLLVVAPREAESSHAPEFRYLFSHCLLQAREVFGEVTVAEEAPDTVDGFEAVLLLGSSRVLISRRSL
ncbi:MAG TPA: hypothetical protein VJ885_07210, partial [Thermoanaerobaculia bacterium]|nr:hypothetical protein [Thermoanaerobaculia bacterium]